MPNVAVIGLGYWGPNLVRNVHAAQATTLHSLCDLDEERLAALARNYPAAKPVARAQAVFDDPDVQAVAIATPVASHFPLARMALEAGKHVLLEKPLTHSVEAAEELVALARAKGLVLMVDHIYLFHPAVRKIKEILDAGELGDLYFVDGVRINLGLFQHDVNVVWDLAPHDLSLVDYLLGREPRSISAFGADHTGGGLEDVAHLCLEYGGGLIATFHVNWLSPVKLRHTMLGGSRKSLVFNDLDTTEPVKVYDSGIEVRSSDLAARRDLLISYRSGDVWSPHVERAEPLRRLVEHFAQCIEQGARPLSDGEQGLRVVRVLDAAQRSIQAQGGRIRL